MQGREIGLIGLGKMGKNIAIQMHNKKYDVLVWNRSKDPVHELEKMGIRSAESIESMVNTLKPTRTIWVMLPSAATAMFPGTAPPSHVVGLWEN